METACYELSHFNQSFHSLAENLTSCCWLRAWKTQRWHKAKRPSTSSSDICMDAVLSQPFWGERGAPGLEKKCLKCLKFIYGKRDREVEVPNAKAIRRLTPWGKKKQASVSSSQLWPLSLTTVLHLRLAGAFIQPGEIKQHICWRINALCHLLCSGDGLFGSSYYPRSNENLGKASEVVENLELSKDVVNPAFARGRLCPNIINLGI